jgi:hypothetical protein
MTGSITEAQHWHREGVAEGERRATAAIVAYLQAEADIFKDGLSDYAKHVGWVIGNITSGDHLKGRGE